MHGLTLGAGAGALALMSCLAVAQTSTHVAEVVDNTGKRIGAATFQGGKSATVIRVELAAGALTPGWHGIHLHAVCDCSDHAKFQASKGHVNHGGRKHGLLNPEGPDDGDLPNIHAGADGSVTAEVVTSTLLSTLKDADGSALVIHAAADDHMTQPIGGAGARVACGLVK